MPHVVDFITTRLSRYDTSRLDWIKLLPLNRKTLLHGACSYPFRRHSKTKIVEQGYRIRASVNVDMAPPFSYRHWGRIASATAKQGWRSGERVYYFDDLEECAVHTLAHECFHFLSHSQQVEPKNTEANANWLADQWLADFRSRVG